MLTCNIWVEIKTLPPFSVNVVLNVSFQYFESFSIKKYVQQWRRQVFILGGKLIICDVTNVEGDPGIYPPPKKYWILGHSRNIRHFPHCGGTCEKEVTCVNVWAAPLEGRWEHRCLKFTIKFDIQVACH